MRVQLAWAAIPLMVASAASCGGTANTGGTNDAGADSTSGEGQGGGPHDDGASAGGDASRGSIDSGGGSPVNDDGGSNGGADAGTVVGGDTGGVDGGGASTDAGPREPPGGASVYLFHKHINRDGFFVNPAITKSAVGTFHNDPTFNGTIAGHVYASPLYADSSLCPDGKGAIYIATQDNNVYRLDETTGTPLWTQNVGTPATSSGAGCGDISPIGVTGTPAIDPVTKTIILDAALGGGGGISSHTVFGLDACSGKPKWNVPLATVKDPMGNTFVATGQNQRCAALVANGYAYFAFGGFVGDCGGYHGWVMGVPTDGNAANAHGWRTQVAKGGIWGPGGAASDGQSVFVTTGNGAGGGATWAEQEGVIRLGIDLSFTHANADFYSPANWQALDQGDLDMSGSGPLVIDAPAMTPTALVMAQGKDGNLYLIDRTNLGGVGANIVGMLHVMVSTINNAGAFATIGGTTYVVVRGNNGAGCPNGTSGNVVTIKLDPASPQKMSMVWCGNGGGRGDPIITSSDGTHDAVVWVAGAEGDSKLHAFDLATGQSLLVGGNIPGIRHLSTTLLAAHGRIFAAGDGQVYALTH